MLLMSILISIASIVCVYSGYRIKNRECRSKFYNLGMAFAVMALVLAIKYTLYQLLFLFSIRKMERNVKQSEKDVDNRRCRR